MPSWKGPELLQVSIPNILKSFREDSKLILILNEADEESIDICRDNKVEFFANKTNWGTTAIDFLASYVNSEYWGTCNSDMVMSEGWDAGLIKIIEGRGGKCSASCQLIEPYGTGNPLVQVEDLGGFNQNAVDLFWANHRMGEYNRDSVVGYNHPIICKTEDYLKVGGYGNNFDKRFVPLCYSLDNHFFWRLWKLHNKDFTCISSGKDFCYHGISMTNKKFGPNYQRIDDGVGHFVKDSGMHWLDLNREIGAFNKIET